MAMIVSSQPRTLPSAGSPAAVPRIAVFVWLVLLSGAAPARAQSTDVAAPPANLDERLLTAVYGIEHPLFRGYVETSGRSFYPVLYGVAPAAWAGVWLFRRDGDWSDAYRLTLAEVGAVGSTMVLKRLIRRPRPYMEMPGIERRTGRADSVAVERLVPASFPSGHAAVSFALVTSWGLSHPRWYVFAPGAVWAVGVSLDRLWRGMHYPSDVLAGALLGVAIGAALHLVGPYVTPDVLESDASAGAPPVLSVRVPL